ncbi:unnamed protein product [Rotaria sp. Silwood1]|nr:unnamed protein product [Rotaria sp. Silwood1]CAF3846395.1 unnamed protein product [Rotaria sp. Silwood1]CAF4973103.1 unnamed protein product [Rotaria sp. Silwood1]CAF4992591.1 unnamed protein product [Rotaria sp. Silwood1]
MKLIIDHKNHPLWVTPDGHIFFLESFPSAYKQAHVFIITIADPISQPEYIQEYKLSACSLYATVSINHIAKIKCDEAWYRTTLEFFKKYLSIKNDQFRRLLLFVDTSFDLFAANGLT